VIGYYALSMGGVAKDDLPRYLGRGLPGYQARRFYSRFGFKDIDGDRHGRMYMRIDDALELFREARNDE
jgi:hypothetical protein